MTKRTDPWFKFYPADWRAEASLRAVSMSARALWMEMLCLMHEAEPRGHLLLNGRPMTDAQLAALAGVPLDIAQALLGELESAGTFSRTRAGVIYSRRMRKDTGVSAKQRANVEKRWNKPAAQTSEKQGGIEGRITKPIPTPIPKKPEAREEKVLTHLAEWVETIWSMQPVLNGKRRSARPDVRRSLEAVLRRGADPQAVVAACRRFYDLPDSKRDGGQYAMGAHRLLEADRWKDYAAGALPAKPMTENGWRAALQVWADDHEWLAQWGPKPGEPGCRVPANLLHGAAA